MKHLNSIVIAAGNADLAATTGLQRSGTQILERHSIADEAGVKRIPQYFFPPIVKLLSGSVFNSQQMHQRQSDCAFGWTYPCVAIATKDIELRFSVAS